MDNTTLQTLQKVHALAKEWLETYQTHKLSDDPAQQKIAAELNGILSKTQLILSKSPSLASSEAASPEKSSASTSANLTDSVGQGGKNNNPDVQAVQKLLNQRLGLSLTPDGVCGKMTITAIVQFQKSVFNGWADGKIDAGGKTWKALSGNNTPVNPNPNPNPNPTPNNSNKWFKLGGAGDYRLSIPPNASGTYPFLLIFAGMNQKSDALIKDLPASYLSKAIVVFSTEAGSFSNATQLMSPILAANGGISTGSVSICGFSRGGQTLFKNLGNVTKTAGFIDPTTYHKNLAQLDSKAVYLANPSIWSFGGGHPTKSAKEYTAGQAQRDAVTVVASKGGVSEIKNGNHLAMPAYFFGKYESKLI